MASRPLPQPRRLQTHCLKTKSTASSDPGLEQTNGAHKGFPGFPLRWGNLRSEALGRRLALGRLPASRASISSSPPTPPPVWALWLFVSVPPDVSLLPQLFVLLSLSVCPSSPSLFPRFFFYECSLSLSLSSSLYRSIPSCHPSFCDISILFVSFSTVAVSSYFVFFLFLFSFSLSPVLPPSLPFTATSSFPWPLFNFSAPFSAYGFPVISDYYV